MDIHIRIHIIIRIIAYVYIKLLFWRINMFHILADMFDRFFFFQNIFVEVVFGILYFLLILFVDDEKVKYNS
jgi:hypothetical protein